ncbi:hypothetical protein EOI86_22435 [Hwanghaeella grinnelliae]|uniref:Lipoprotein n=1 Tax=Hwanghaeella grinnelliae TaxID=2500179 RepID=A0A3S2VME7_9PROT|nr:hypothetical protein [Hwanghaeella grinnelliae]RVU33892.1 hypothetical protein EOI86_22435 [Hwanghaeella grinnelliae]
MRGSDSILQLALAFTVSTVLAGCVSTWEEVGAADVSLSNTPVVSGNTFDRYNDLAVIPPHSENLSISYRYKLESPGKGDSVSGVNGPVWFYAERSAATPESFFQVGLVSSDGEAQPVEAGAADEPIVETIRLGSIRYRSTLYCVDPMSGAVPASIAGFVNNVANHGHGLSNSLFVRHYEGEGPGLDGRWLSMAFVLDITRMGYDCEAIGDPSAPEIPVQDVVENFKDAAARSFEVVR